MTLDDLLNNTGEWIRCTGPVCDIVMSSRVRLARNLADYPFSHWASKKEQETVLETSRQSILSIKKLKDSLFLEIGKLDPIDKQFLVERHLMSKEHMVDSENKGLCVGQDEVISIMINEEDHIRMQVMKSGFNLKEAWQILNDIDTELGNSLDFAYSVDFGYLTACPTNTGTGMRASVMLHLPSLVMTKQIGKVLQAITKLSLTARGLYGEGTEASGNFFQISNQVSLGHKEEDVIDNIDRIIKQIVDHEQSARETLLAQNREALEDRIWRAYGTLKSAHIITSTETIDLLSLARLGVDLGVIKQADRTLINELFVITQPAHLQKLEKKKLSPNQRDVKRAEIIREKLGK
ncbi:MAG: protein arginine kinase [Candidatus Omnitrophica bacterium CG22_combo_CG10-13_8_21_14_all_43_16]|nr:MAG: protein arginine kinase [Candidatus Omnitrophica bacterium CG22_combo_CG10-13_8_21_14_all_43_16]